LARSFGLRSQTSGFRLHIATLFRFFGGLASRLRLGSAPPLRFLGVRDATSFRFLDRQDATSFGFFGFGDATSFGRFRFGDAQSFRLFRSLSSCLCFDSAAAFSLLGSFAPRLGFRGSTGLRFGPTPLLVLDRPTLRFLERGAPSSGFPCPALRLSHALGFSLGSPLRHARRPRRTYPDYSIRRESPHRDDSAADGLDDVET
jgi:hypothetical protein